MKKNEKYIDEQELPPDEEIKRDLKIVRKMLEKLLLSQEPIVLKKEKK